MKLELKAGDYLFDGITVWLIKEGVQDWIRTITGPIRKLTDMEVLTYKLLGRLV